MIQIAHNDPWNLYEDPTPMICGDEEIVSILIEERRVIDNRKEEEPGCIFDAWPKDL